MVAGIRPLAALAGVAAFLSVLQFLTLLLGAAGVQLGRGIAVVVVALSVGAAFWFSTRFREPDADRTDARTGLLSWVLRGAGIGLCLWFLALWIDLWILAYARPSYDWDGLYYHIPAMHAWTLQGGIQWIDSLPGVIVINYPMGVEACTYLMHYVLGTSRLVDGCNLWYWPLGFVSLAVIAEQLGAKGVWRWVAGALLAGASVFVSLSVTSYIDPGFAAAVMAAVAVSCVVVFHDLGDRWCTAALFGMALGLMLGAKGTGAPFTVIVLAGTAVAVLVMRRAAHWKTWLLRGAVSAAVALAVGGAWYARAWAETGNPFYPIGVRFGEKTLIEGYDPAVMLDWNLPPSLETYPGAARMFVSWLQLDAPISGHGAYGGMGYVWLLGCVPALVYLWVTAVRRRDGPRARTLAFLTLLLLVLLAVQPATWWARFTLWLHALGLPAIAVVLGDAADRLRSDRRHLVTVVLALAVAGLAVWESQRTLRLEWRTGRVPDSSEAGERFYSTREYVFPGMDQTPLFHDLFEARTIARTPWETRVGPLLGGVLALPLGDRRTVIVPREITAPDVEGLRGSGVEWLIWEQLVEKEPPGVLLERTSETSVFRYPSEGVFHLFRLSPGS